MNHNIAGYRNSQWKAVVLSLTVLICLVLASVINVHYRIDIVYTHFFYLPIILAGLWYYWKALWLAAFLGMVHIICNFIVNDNMSPGVLIRTLMFLTVALVVGTLSKRNNNLYEALQVSEKDLRRLNNTMLDIISQINSQGIFEYVSPSVKSVLGYENTNLIGKSLFDFVHPDDVGQLKTTFRAATDSHSPMRLDYRYLHIEGYYLWVESVANPMLDADESIIVYVFGSRDITARKRAEEALQKSEERWQLALQGSNSGIWDWDIQTGEVFYSSRWREISDCEGIEISNRLYEWENWIYPDDRDWVKETIQAHLEKKAAYYWAEHRIICQDGSYKWVMDRGQALWDEEGKPVRMVGSRDDITDRKLKEKKLEYLSLYDSLTGVYNRTFFEQEKQRLDTGRYDPVGVVMCDVDGMKLVNDNLGHKAGDSLLVAAANILKTQFRASDIVARIGGDEFAVLLQMCPENLVEEACQRVRDVLANSSLEEWQIPVRMSMGYATRNDPSRKMNELVKEADSNMYLEKLQHRERYSAVFSKVQALRD
ncbi:MAG: hypothetical protein CVU90_02800 [Firmicutes bacterium HGW-Firmicutes-15]|nr:MAG: hypothetical protein CVU90_02800 [Firmicutes bacterium HGW-Firmicutes-15]